MAGLITGLATTFAATALAMTSADAGDTTSGYAPTDVFGSRTGYVHPFMSVSMLGSDNINNTRDDEIGDWSTIYSPGIWLAVPRSNEARLSLVTSNTAPGGQNMFMEKTASFSRYQAYAFYGADIHEYHTHSELDTVKQAGEGFFQYNFRGGLSIDVFDKYIDSEDPMGTGDTTVIDDFKNNLTGVTADYQISDKLRLRTDYSHFYLDYNLAASSGKDRDDNSYAGYVYYSYSPKTSLFLNYKYIDVSYDTNTSEDNEQHHYNIGLKWQPTEKTNLLATIGMVDRSSDNAAGDDSGLAAELTATHELTAKSTLQVVAARKISESTVSTAAYSTDSLFTVSLMENFSDKIAGIMAVTYSQNDFQENAGEISRTDDLYSIAPSLRYMLKDWLMADLGYEYSERDSDIDTNDYKSNKLYLRFSAGF